MMTLIDVINCFPSGLAPQFNALLVSEKALVLSLLLAAERIFIKIV